ncbi:MAG TPA: hypothetical protein VF702_07725 [Allosphingosinicella sp.]|jgi:hypothetical protein
MTRDAALFRDKPCVLHGEEARWFAHRLFGRSGGGAAPAPAAGWRAPPPPPKEAA